MILREALHVAAARVDAEDVPGSAVAAHEEDLHAVRIVAPHGRHVVRAAEADALPVDVDLRVAAGVRYVGELAARAVRRVRVETALRHLRQVGAVRRAAPDVALAALRDHHGHLSAAAERDAEDEARLLHHLRVAGVLVELVAAVRETACIIHGPAGAHRRGERDVGDGLHATEALAVAVDAEDPLLTAAGGGAEDEARTERGGRAGEVLHDLVVELVDRAADRAGRDVVLLLEDRIRAARHDVEAELEVHVRAAHRRVALHDALGAHGAPRRGVDGDALFLEVRREALRVEHLEHAGEREIAARRIDHGGRDRGVAGRRRHGDLEERARSAGHDDARDGAVVRCRGQRARGRRGTAGGRGRLLRQRLVMRRRDRDHARERHQGEGQERKATHLHREGSP